MNGILIDSCVLLDLFTDDPNWADWAEIILEQYRKTNSLFINAFIYAEVSIGFTKIEDVEAVLAELNIKVLEMPREALFLAGKVFLAYRQNKGRKQSPLPDFFIGAHASVSQLNLITRDTRNYQTYFPKASLIRP
ncbi:PIN domain-containing protein [Synechococcales cyanobacterium C]|uniref:PIN domain-containing protein n=2 Tax=Petrachloros TaxID=2918834 RepID=A0A8K2A6H6_9CYAN|nr:PIN domain-containing protein [Petrachloros mirabilis ULC683]